MKVLIVLQHRFELWNAPSWFAEKLKSDFPQLEIVHLPSYEGVEKDLRDAEVVITWSLRPEQFAVAKHLRWIHSPAAAVHQLLFAALVNSNVVLTNARDVHAPVVAEHVLALLFAVSKKIPQCVRLQQKRVWGKEIVWKEPPRPRELAGATLLSVGLGSIGRAVAKSAAALGIRVIAVRKQPEKGSADGVEQVFPATELDNLIPQADYVLLAAPRTPDTEKIMDAARIARMKPEAYLINVSRGALVDEAALARALGQKKIAGAALDVFAEEPLRPESPLWDLENLLITPHTAAITDKLWDRHYDLIHKNLRRYLAGEPLLAEVDKKRGY